MRDPFPLPNPVWLQKAIQPFADYFHLTTLPLHIHEIFYSFIFYTLINSVIAPYISQRLFPREYSALTGSRRLNWNVHVVSLVQSSCINVLALWVMWTDDERWNMTQIERVFGYTGGAGMIQGLAAGYFLWDLVITLQHVQVFGLGMLAHAVCALVVFSFGFRPFINYYSTTFILYELSSPFLNFHWFFDKLNMTGSRAQLINGVLLITTFFGCRLVWGTYSSVKVYQDIWAGLNHTPAAGAIRYDALNVSDVDAARGKSAAPLNTGIMRYAGEEYVPLWLALVYLASNIVLHALNIHWFGKMIETIRKRFEPAKVDKVTEKPIVERTTGADGKVRTGVDQTEVRRRVIEREVVPSEAAL